MPTQFDSGAEKDMPTLSGYNGAPLPSSVDTLLRKLSINGIVAEVTGRAGKTIVLRDSNQRRGYINSTVLGKKCVLGFEFGAWGYDGGACPAEFVDTLVPSFCSRYDCKSDDVVVHHGSGSNSGRTFLLIRDPGVALRAVLQDAGHPVIEPILCETPEQLEREVVKLGKVDFVPRGQLRPSKAVYSADIYKRDARVVAYVKTQANGVCECCGGASPFVHASDGEPYLEVHHVKQLSDAGSDTVSNAVALCPNCHRELHHGHKAEALKERLYINVDRLDIE